MLRVLFIPRIHYRWWMFLLAFLLGLLVQEAIFAQSMPHRLTNGNLPPGKASEIALRSNPNFYGYVQPVKIVTPGEARVGFWTGNGYATAEQQGPMFGMTLGTVYRVKITNIPGHPGAEIFPSIELLSRLHPPEGKELEFPVPVEITLSDLELAIEGKMVTKVVYLEDPDTALPFQQIGDHQRNIDISGYEDTLNTADRLGRPMALVRLGSRQPLADDQAGAFEFFGPGIQILNPAEAGQEPVQLPAQPGDQSGSRSFDLGVEKASYLLGDQ